MDLTVEQKQAGNVWDHIDEVLPVLEAARKGEWSWTENFKCKYIELRIDMRSGHIILKDRDGNRINPADLKRQHGNHGTLPWPTEPEELGDWQRAEIARVANQPTKG